MKLKHVNAVVVGSGAGGGAIAKALSEAGLSVVVLEQGTWMDKFEHHDDELLLMDQRILGPSDKHIRVVSRTGDGKNWVTRRANTGLGTMVNAHCVGGGTQYYAALAWRFVPEDFRMRSTYGEVGGASLEDWPISYEDLAPYYEKVEWEVRVSGDNSDNPFTAPMEKDYPMPAFPHNQAGKLLVQAGKRLGYHPAPVAMFRNSIPFRGRPACAQRRKCIGYACPWNARAGSQNTTIPDALATGNCEIRVYCHAYEIVIDDRGHANGVRYFNENDKDSYQTADIVISSAGAIETARLLLNSKSKLFPNGAGNNYDLVGRYLQGHKYMLTRGWTRERVDGGPGPGRTVCFLDFMHYNDGVIGGGSIEGTYPSYPLATALRQQGWGKHYKDNVRDKYGKDLSLLGCVQELPLYESRVYLDPKVKDSWGIPVVRIHKMIHPRDFDARNLIAEKTADILEEAGATGVYRQIVEVPKENRFDADPHGHHQAGTCRMGTDKKRSVTNPYGQVHEIDNLFVADAALHVTNSGLNPSATIKALGFRIGEYIAKEWNGTKFKS